MNYFPYQNELQFLSRQWLRGFELYSLGDYPYAVRCENRDSKILAEVFRISDPAVGQSINQLELEAGYYLDFVSVEQGRAGIYLFKKSVNDIRIKSGDWVDFFGQIPK